VLFRSGEIQKCGPEILFFEQPHIHLQPVRQRETHLVLAVRQHLIDPRVLQNVFGHLIDYLLPRGDDAIASAGP